jgi:hypothetical protein
VPPPCNAKVPQLDEALLGEEDVLSFQVPVQHVMAVHMLQRQQHLHKPAQHLQAAEHHSATTAHVLPSTPASCCAKRHRQLLHPHTQQAQLLPIWTQPDAPVMLVFDTGTAAVSALTGGAEHVPELRAAVHAPAAAFLLAGTDTGRHARSSLS